MASLYAELEEALEDHKQGICGFTMSADEAHVVLDHWAEAEARAMRLEWEKNNHCMTAERKGDGVDLYETVFDVNDPRHKWVWADWLNAAREKLRRE